MAVILRVKIARHLSLVEAEEKKAVCEDDQIVSTRTVAGVDWCDVVL